MNLIIGYIILTFQVIAYLLILIVTILAVRSRRKEKKKILEWNVEEDENEEVNE